MRRLAPVLILVSLFALRALSAQSTNGTIAGQVTDASKALVAGAKISLINTGTNAAYAGVTDASGSYLVSGIPPGNYQMEVERSGFRTIIKPNVVVHVQDALEINFEMTIGAVSETVTVSGGASMINTTD